MTSNSHESEKTELELVTAALHAVPGMSVMTDPDSSRLERDVVPEHRSIAKSRVSVQHFAAGQRRFHFRDGLGAQAAVLQVQRLQMLESGQRGGGVVAQALASL